MYHLWVMRFAHHASWMLSRCPRPWCAARLFFDGARGRLNRSHRCGTRSCRDLSSTRTANKDHVVDLKGFWGCILSFCRLSHVHMLINYCIPTVVDVVPILRHDYCQLLWFWPAMVVSYINQIDVGNNSRSLADICWHHQPLKWLSTKVTCQCDDICDDWLTIGTFYAQTKAWRQARWLLWQPQAAVAGGRSVSQRGCSSVAWICESDGLVRWLACSKAGS